MIKTILSLSFPIVGLLSCTGHQADQKAMEPIKTTPHPIAYQMIIDSTRSVIFWSEDSVLTPGNEFAYSYCNAALVNNKDTIPLDSLCGFDTYYELSPDKKFILLSRISRGWIYHSETDSVWHEQAFCQKINTETGAQTGDRNCFGEWPQEPNIIKG